jgi:hypothetical protein
MADEYEVLSRKPCNIFRIRCAADIDPLLGGNSLPPLTKAWFDYLTCEFRGVPLERLATVLRQGIDVQPTTEVIYADSASKAFEYGGWPKVLWALSRDSLRRTFREVSADIPEDEIQSLRCEFPTIVQSIDGSKLWCTRLREDAPQIATDYEISYAYWIPGDPWTALKAVFVLVRPQDHERFSSYWAVTKPQ